MERINDATLENWFEPHKLTPDQLTRYMRVTEATKALAHLILEVCPEDNADRTFALRQLRRLKMDINTAIACEKQSL